MPSFFSRPGGPAQYLGHPLLALPQRDAGFFEALYRQHRDQGLPVVGVNIDYEILRQIDFESVRPRVLLYEHEYMRQVERKRCEAMLASRGYALSRRLGDTLAYLPF